ncbi:38244_t:CDS:1, partial [Gigaspora margarita]
YQKGSILPREGSEGANLLRLRRAAQPIPCLYCRTCFDYINDYTINSEL